MELLIDYLESAAAWFREQREALRKLDAQYRKSADRDVKREMISLRGQMRKKSSGVGDELILRLDELRYLKKYFPELLGAFLEDPDVGPLLEKKAWLLDFRPMPPQEASMRLQELKAWRAQLRDARKFLRGWIGTVNARAFAATYPLLRGYVHGEMDKEDVAAAIKKADGVLRREGWLLLITPALVEIPLAKFISAFSQASYEEGAAKAECRRAEGRGTIAEAAALRKLQQAARKRAHYERAVRHILLASPEYLSSLKKRSWLARGKQSALQRIARDVTPHAVKERVWLNEMRRRLEQ